MVNMDSQPAAGRSYTKSKVMKNKSKLGIWLDHASAHLISFKDITLTVTKIESTFTHQRKEEALSKSESKMHNKEEQEQGEYYKKIGAVILDYDEILLFGPSDAKVELHNVLKKDHHFDTKIFDIQQADKMTEHQEQAFVKDYFSAK